jgi:hypothetical protein
MEINNKLTGIIRGRSIELVTQEEALVTIVFHDYSTMRVKATGAPTTNMSDELSFQVSDHASVEATGGKQVRPVCRVQR